MRRLIPLLLLSLTACTPLPERPAVSSPDQTWDERRQSLQQIQQWQLKGRLAIINDVEAWHLNVDWQQRNNDYLISMWGPFGAGRVELTGNDSGVRLVDADQAVYYSADPESLLYEHTGVRMPVNGLRYWILGLAHPAREVARPTLDQYGRLASVSQDKWDVQLRHYTRIGAHELPDKLSISRDDIKVKVVVDDWNLDQQD